MKRCTWILGLILGLMAGTAQADGFLVPTSHREPVRGPWAVKDHRVRITVEGQRATTEVRQTFLNLTRSELEVKYLFPVPEGAILNGFTLIVDGKRMEGRILPAAQAIHIYESIVRQKKDPALLTYAGRGVVETAVFPIPGGGSREVVIRYDELLRKDGNLVKIHYPLDTERFSALPIQVVDIRVEIDSAAPLKTVYSPSHPIRVKRPSRNRAIASYSEENVTPDRDLTIYYTVGDGELDASVFSYFPETGDAGHFLLLLSPGALHDDTAPMGKNLVIVLDHSGSMRGDKIRQAKEALAFVLNSLGDKDRVNLVAFSSAAESLYPSVRPFSGKVREEAMAFVDRLTAGGGTDIHGALTMAISGLGEDEERQNAVLFLTDGLPTVGIQDVRQIVKDVTGSNRERGSARLFVFGVGYDVNAPFLDRLVEENGGVSENIHPKDSVEIAVTALYEKIRHTVLTDLMMSIQGIDAHDVYPRRLPDLFAGSQLVVVGRYRKGGPGAVVLGGKSGRTKVAFKFPLRFETASDPDEKPFVARVWATTKIGFLLDQMRVMDRREQELIDEIVRLSMKYGIVTEYTAFLADERNDFRDLAVNSGIAREELQKRLAEATGGAGSNQAVNTKRLRHQQHAELKNRWNDAQGREVQVSTVRNIGRKTFYRRGGVWIDREVAEGETPEEVVAFSERFFELVRGQSAAENRWLSFKDPVIVRLAHRTVKVVPAR